MSEEMKKILDDHEKRIKTLEDMLIDSETPKPKKKISLKEFILTKKPTGDAQKTLAVGYFLEGYEDFSSFNVKDLEDCFRIAKEKVPKNINDVVNKNIRKGFMMESKEEKDGKKTWVLTASGERFVENDFKKE